ncbi:MAG TPA: crossover junction endodeoxyribonuclease RuvC [Planctomycetota bacterium]|jgi:crossover junction endodeoxyribonuclease RuvC
MALDGPYTVDDLLAMTGHKPKAAPKWLVGPASLPAGATELKDGRHGGRRYPAKDLRLLGVDPGTLRVGWGVVRRGAKDGALTLVECGCIRPSPKLDLKARLCEIFAELEGVILRLKPDAAALEETFAGVNMKSAIAMGEGRGIALLCLARAKLEVLEISPRSIKQAVTGSGASGKPRVAAMVCAQLGLKVAPKPEDVTDALAAAIALGRRVG